MPESLQRIKAVIAYDGGAFYGFQKQTSTKHTITYEIEKALKRLHIEASIVGSGRTDAGVHATGQVIHFDIPDYWQDLHSLALNLNRHLQKVRIKHLCKVSADFHARFSAKKRVYRYIFKTTKPSLFEENYIAYYQRFDKDKLMQALQSFEGRHDFDFFRKTGSPTPTSVREIYKTQYRVRGNYHYLYFEANGFLRAQVRMMVATAMEYAQGNSSLEEIEAKLKCQSTPCTKLAAPQGLYLAKVLY